MSGKQGNNGSEVDSASKIYLDCPLPEETQQVPSKGAQE